MFQMTYRLIRSNRKTISIEMGPEGLVVRAPHRMSRIQIDRFIDRKKDWIVKHQSRWEEQAKEAAKDPLSMDEIRQLAGKALEVIPGRAAFYAPKIGVTYGKITIKKQRTRWGSCSSKGNLNFNCLLMLTPPEVVDSVVVHELCHRKEMNHSEKFYAEVLRVFPDYYKWNGWLKEHGPGIMRRMTGA